MAAARLTPLMEDAAVEHLSVQLGFERRGWELYYNVLDCLESDAADPDVSAWRQAARSIVDATRLN